MQSPVSGKRKEKSKKNPPQETVLLRYPEPKYKFEGRKIPKKADHAATTPLLSEQSPAPSSKPLPSSQNASSLSSLKAGTGGEVARPSHESHQHSISTATKSTISSPQPAFSEASPRVTQVSPTTSGHAVSGTSKTKVAVAAGVSLSGSDASAPQSVTIPKTSKPVSIVDPLHPRVNSKNGQELPASASSEDLQRGGGRSALVEDLQEQLRKTQADLESVRKQLDVQLQVNADLKKLLVASMGEELESRVERLTRDKAEMTQELGGFSRRMTEDYENMDRLSIQADMWRSKYLASKVMVDELASSRAFLTMQFQESQEALQQMLNERHELRANLKEAYKCLQQVKEAFDPLNSQRSPTSLPSANALSLAKTTQQLAETIRFRLLPSHISLHTVVPIEDSWQASMTQAEAHANELLSRKVDLDTVNFASLPLSKSGKIERYHPQVNFDNLTINCCAHCKGEISLI